jgi:hypothetical protein
MKLGLFADLFIKGVSSFVKVINMISWLDEFKELGEDIELIK